MQQQQQYPQLWLRQNHPLREHEAVEYHYNHHRAGEQLQPNYPGPRPHLRPWNHVEGNGNRHLVLPHDNVPDGEAHYKTKHGQIWRLGPDGFAAHPNRQEAPQELQQAWAAHQETLGSVEHVLVVDNNLLGHLCPLASIAQSMDEFARNIFVTFVFECKFPVHQMQNLLAHNLPSHLPHRCGTLVYREKPNSSKRQELQTALTPYLESHEVQLSGCLFDLGSFGREEFETLKSLKALPPTLPCASLFTTSALHHLFQTDAKWHDRPTSENKSSMKPQELMHKAHSKYGKVEQVSQKLADALHLAPKPGKPPVVACSTRALEPSALLWLKEHMENEMLLPVGTQMRVKTRGRLPDNVAAFVHRGCWLIATGSLKSNAFSVASLEHLCGIFLANGLNVLVLCPGLGAKESQQLLSNDRSGGQRMMVQREMISSIELFQQQNLQGALLLGGWGMANEALANRKPAIYLPMTKEQECTAHVMQHSLGEIGAAVLPSLAKDETFAPTGDRATALQKALKLSRAQLPNEFNQVLKTKEDKETKELQNVKYLLKYLNVKLK